MKDQPKVLMIALVLQNKSLVLILGKQMKKVCLSLHYNGGNRYLFVKKMLQEPHLINLVLIILKKHLSKDMFMIFWLIPMPLTNLEC